MLTEDPSKLYIVGVDGNEDETHPLYDERARLPCQNTLVQSLMSYGNRVEVIVRKGPEGRLEVVDGRQRVKAARLANARLAANNELQIRLKYTLDVDASVDETMAQGISNLTNAVRFADDPITESYKTVRYLARLLGKPEEDALYVAENSRDEHLSAAADVFGCGTQTIGNRIAFCLLDPGVILLVKSGKLKYTTALQLSELPVKEQLGKAKEFVEDGATIAEARASVKASAAGTKVDRGDKTTIGAVILRQVVKLALSDGKACRLSDAHLVALRVVCGQLTVNSVPGLEEYINRVEAGERPETGLVKKRKV